jgi:hypothetical protein
VRPLSKRILLLVSIACALVAASAAPTPASAAAPCWKVLLNDWLDGRIDNLYPVSCYRAAIKHLPTDIDTYSSARDDILRALQARIAGKGAPPNKDTQQGGGTPPGNGGTGGPGSTGGGGPAGSGPVGDAARATAPSSVDAVPLPLIVLSAIAGVLLALGAAGFLVRRIQSRRVAVRPVESSSSGQNR